MNRTLQAITQNLPGASAANPWVLLFLTPFLVFFGTSAYYDPTGFSLEYVAGYLAFTHLITSSYLLLTNFLLVRFFKVADLLRLTILYIGGGVVDSISLILGFAIEWRVPGTGLSAWVVITIGSLIVSAWLFMGHLALGLLVQNFRRYGELQAANEQLTSLADSAQQQLEEFRGSLQQAISERVESVLTQIGDQLQSIRAGAEPSRLIAAASRVRELAENDVRSLSHELAAASPERELAHPTSSSINWRRFIAFGGDSSANIPWVMAVGTLMAMSLALAIGELVTVVVVITALCLGFPVLAAVDRLRLRSLKSAPLWVQVLSAPIEYLALATIGVEIVRLLTQGIAELQEEINIFSRAVPIGAVTIWFLIFVIRGLSSAVAVRASELAAVSQQLQAKLDLLNFQLREASNRLARILHGTVQGRVASVSLALTAMANEADQQKVNQLLQQAQTQLELVRSDLVAAFADELAQASFEDELANLRNGWDGLVQFEIEIPEPVSSMLGEDRKLASAVIHAMQECVTNAVRHGAATVISFQFDEVDGHVALTVRSNGSGGQDSIEPGMGWKLMVAEARTLQMNKLGDRFEVSLSW